MKYLLLRYGIILFFFFFPFAARAYPVEVHAHLTDAALALYASEYAREGIADAMQPFLIDGSRHEDDGARYINHFLDPSTGKGLTDPVVLDPFRATSVDLSTFAIDAKTWAQDEVSQTRGVIGDIPLHPVRSRLSEEEKNLLDAFTSNYTWQRAIREYRNGNTEEALYALGHVMHLIQDMHVPAHTRNDAHPPFDHGGSPYERYSRRYTPETPDLDLLIRGVAAPSYGATSLDALFDASASYSHENFYSRDTMDTYPVPVVTDLVRIGEGRYETNGSIYLSRLQPVLYGSSRLFDHAVVLQNNWEHLSGYAVRASADLIELFFEAVSHSYRDPNFTHEDPPSFSRLFTSTARDLLTDAKDTVIEKGASVSEGVATVSCAGDVIAQRSIEDIRETSSRVLRGVEALQSSVEEVVVDTVLPEEREGVVEVAEAKVSSPPPFVPVLRIMDHTVPRTSVAAEDSSIETPEVLGEVVTTTPDPPLLEEATSTQAVVAPHDTVSSSGTLLVSEVYADMEGSDTREFVELYNAGSEAVSLDGWSLQYLSGSATTFEKIKKKDFPDDAVIAPSGYYLIGMGKFDGAYDVDFRWSQSLHNTGAHLFLVQDTERIASHADAPIIDSVTYGEGAGIVSSASYVGFPEPGVSLERKAFKDGACFVSDDVATGNGCDTDVHQSDFFIQSTPNPTDAGGVLYDSGAPILAADGLSLSYVASEHWYRGYTPYIEISWEPLGDDVSHYVLYDEAGDVLDDGYYATDEAQFTGTSYQYPITYINDTYTFQVVGVLADGSRSDPLGGSIEIPSYFSQVVIEKEDDMGYTLSLSWTDGYPIIPIDIPKIYIGTVPAWKVVLLQYNPDSELPTILGEINETFLWGTSHATPDALQVQYGTCAGGGTYASIILPDTVGQCEGSFSGVERSGYATGFSEAGKLEVSVPIEQFGDDLPGKNDFIRISYYTYIPGANKGGNQGLVAIDSEKYYFSE